VVNPQLSLQLANEGGSFIPPLAPPLPPPPPQRNIPGAHFC